MARLPWTSPRRQPNPQRCPRIFHAKVEAGSFRCNFIKIHRRLRTSHAMAAGTSFPVDSSAFVSTASSPIAVEPTYSPSVSSYCYIMLKPVPSPGAQSTTAPCDKVLTVCDTNLRSFPVEGIDLLVPSIAQQQRGVVRAQSEPFAKRSHPATDALEAGNFLNLVVGNAQPNHSHFIFGRAVAVNVLAVM
jgi:hypothetical protein